MYCVLKSKMTTAASCSKLLVETTYAEDLVAKEEGHSGVATLFVVVLAHGEEQDRRDHKDLEEQNDNPSKDIRKRRLT